MQITNAVIVKTTKADIREENKTLFGFVFEHAAVTLKHCAWLDREGAGCNIAFHNRARAYFNSLMTDDIADSLGMKKAAGAIVDEPQAGSPAAKAGIMTGDVITARTPCRRCDR